MDEFEAAAGQGRICGISLQCWQDVQRIAAKYPQLFPAKPFDPGFFAMLSLVNAFCSPEGTADQIRSVTRVCLWVYAADWQVDYVAKSRDEVEGIARECLSIGFGSDAPLVRFLAEIYDDLATVPEFGPIEPIWRRQLEKFLTAMVKEWEWRSAGPEALPTFEEYLENSDSVGASFVNISHWIFTRDSRTLGHLDELMAVGITVQRALRLLNDFAGYERELAWGDINALLLDLSPAEVRERLDVLIKNCLALVQSLKGLCPDAASYLERQIGFNAGFYGVADYWGQL
ncbi:terpene synthase family protein [Planotetraspora sp. A-T 1434]|uniref:terpene synthase family protein n=1 Tax=Planotetraspora sp. A-T 1434 TaxID=2979219 RepID=UPI0021BE9D6F|nr:terpene synthase family protein [Planotetraspora sp. A-T 1434]MCT9933261.1 terpene synthase family protein [Planotetraspora sp. A-T 1434]